MAFYCLVDYSLMNSSVNKDDNSIKVLEGWYLKQASPVWKLIWNEWRQTMAWESPFNSRICLLGSEIIPDTWKQQLLFCIAVMRSQLHNNFWKGCNVCKSVYMKFRTGDSCQILTTWWIWQHIDSPLLSTSLYWSPYFENEQN